jgi:hypothetical protein
MIAPSALGGRNNLTLTNVPHASGTDLERWLPDRWKAELQSRRD